MHNGPDFLIHDRNSRVYRPSMLRHAVEALAPGGRLLIWCQGPSPELLATLRTLGGSVQQQRCPVTRGIRSLCHVIYICNRDRAPDGPHENSW